MPPAKKSTAKKPQDRKPKTPTAARTGGVTSASEWKRSSEGHELEVPSGKVALVRRMGMQAFISKGVIPNSLMPMVNKAMATGEMDVAGELGDLDEEKLRDIISLYDAVMLQCVVLPELSPIPEDEEGNVVPLKERDQDLLYVDEVDFEDKVFVFQWVVGGTADLESFRAEQAATLVAIHSGENVVAPPIHGS